ncbi:hypothetical protein [uncultured Sphingomonas sp.]|uniref:hypothetical protein n=1 Tax=uncultured Sphingomonas sp. TaxID=158754 RepID=UPI0026396664|nr:hypothetical protein [uncultured Sphingomonas sp.]
MFAKLAKHVRIKPRAAARPTVEEQRHLDRVASMICIGCGAWKVEIHHAMKVPGKIRRRDNRFVVPLCAECHRGDSGVHGLGSEAAFKLKTGVDIAENAIDLWENRHV